MPREKMDLHDFAKEVARAELTERQTANIQLIVFKKNPEPIKKDPMGFHPATNAPVFPDKRRLGRTIKEGEAWFCELEAFTSPLSGQTIYYANPIQRVDAGFLFDLRPDQAAQVVEALGRTANAQVVEQMKSQLKSQVEGQYKHLVETLRSERDVARAEAEAAIAERTRQEEVASALRLEVESLQTRIVELDKKPSTVLFGKDPAPGRHLHDDPAGWEEIDDLGSITVMRPDAERLQSPWFKRGYYAVLVSPDRRALLVRPADEDGIPAVGRQIVVPGLTLLRPFDDPEKLRAQLDTRRGGLLIGLVD